MVGAHVAKALIEWGESEVVLLDRAAPRQALAELLPAGRYAVEPGDVLSVPDLIRVMSSRRVRRVIHTAALLPGPDTSAYDLVQVNVLGTMNVLEAARACGVERLIHVSSTAVYYGAFPSASQGAVTEEAPLVPVPGFFYASSKIASENLALNYADAGELDVIACRLGHVWGAWPGPPRSPIALLLAATVPQLLAGVPVKISDPLMHWRGAEGFVHVENAANGLVRAAEAARVTHRVFNLADERPYSFDDFRRVLAAEIPGASLVAGGEPAGGYAGVPAPPPGPISIERARAELGYRPVTTLEAGLGRVVAAWRGASGG
jgi:UDP-glucose 4-epimerase